MGDPLRFVLAAYGADPSSPDRPSAPELLDENKPEYSPRLRALFAMQQREHGKDEVGRLNMDIFTGSQDGRVSDVRAEAREVDYAAPPRRIIIARFRLEGEPRETRFYFERAGNRWLLDDIAMTGAAGWTLSTLLKYGK